MGCIRILHIVPNMQAGGLETFIMNVYRDIDRSKVQFDFLVHYHKKCFYDSEIEKLGGKIYRFSFREDHCFFRYIKDLNHFFKEYKEYKIIHCHMESIGFIAFLIAKKNGISVRIAHSHNTDVEKTMKGFLKKILMQPFKYVSTVRYACSRKAGQFEFKKKPFEVIPNGIHIDTFSFDEKIRKKMRKELKIEDKYVLGHVGRFCVQKNHSFLIDTFASVHKVYKDTVLLLIGTGELEEEIKRKVKAEHLEDAVLFLGTRKDVNCLYQAMDCFVFPSLFEGLGIVLIEAQASGLPTIASSCVPDEVMVSPSIIQLPLQKEQWKDAILRFKNQKRTYQKMGEELLQYDSKKVAALLQQHYIQYNEEN